ncbi:hypothetical protein GpartN1_g5307.t1 [Galdieria partita]|uniref:Uncharacterized protein n=1 Tax=Galdieria partita TaxID=83374 RepID=A0A9C7Q0W7_9RHOD|nr:hypothetical protein GpartN1_g5307.t1 [Galdieria partita]
MVKSSCFIMQVAVFQCLTQVYPNYGHNRNGSKCCWVNCKASCCFRRLSVSRSLVTTTQRQRVAHPFDHSVALVWKASHTTTSNKDDDQGNSDDNNQKNNSNNQGGSFPFSIFGNWSPFRSSSLSGGGDKEDNPRKTADGFSIPGMGRNPSLSTEQLDISSALAAYDKEKHNELLEFIQQVPPSELVARFMRKTPKDVQNAIKVNLVQLLGSLPPGLFQTSIRTVGMQLMQLMESCLMTGYMLRNAQYRYSLSKSLESVDENRHLLEGQKPLVQGKVTFENADGTTTEMEASEYVQELRSQVIQLEKELSRYKNASGSQLLSYIRTMEQDQLESLTRDMGDEVIDAMKRIIRAVTMETSIAQNPMSLVETSASELSQMLFWLLVTGYFLREAEVQQSIQKMLSN